MRRAVLLAVLAACGGGGGGDKGVDKARGDGAPVEVVERHGGGRPLPFEKEPNDSDEQATPLTVPGGARGVLTGANDADLYSFKVTERGAFDARLTGSGVDLVLELHSKEALLAHSDRGPAGTAEGFPGFVLDPGDYLLLVREFHKPPPRKSSKKKKDEADAGPPGRTGPSPPYQLTLGPAAAPQAHQEAEPDDETGTATELGLGDEAIGWLGWTGDVDLWRVDVAEVRPGYCLDVEVAVPDGAEAALALLDDNADKLVERTGGRSEPVAVRALVPRPGDEHYYVRVSTRRSNPDEPYTLRVVARLHDLDLEAEPDDSDKTATPLRDDPRETGGTRHGWLGAGDVDYWRLPPGGSGVLTVVAAPPPEIDIKLVAVSGTATLEASTGKRGVTERLDGLAVTEGEGIVLKVSGSGSSSAPYELRWSVGQPAAPAYDPYEQPDEP
ncbi:MAG TPA: hypothetical protein VL172_09420 [Kofleriaceae bacterium]|nr:hypothetical protein [Kofleriaceae bacterium]